MKTITRGKIPWYGHPPEQFPCLECQSGRRATELVELYFDDLLYASLVMCPECAAKPETELWAAVGRG